MHNHDAQAFLQSSQPITTLQTYALRLKWNEVIKPTNYLQEYLTLYCSRNTLTNEISSNLTILLSSRWNKTQMTWKPNAPVVYFWALAVTSAVMNNIANHKLYGSFKALVTEHTHQYSPFLTVWGRHFLTWSTQGQGLKLWIVLTPLQRYIAFHGVSNHVLH